MAIRMYDLAGAEAERRFSPYCWRIRMALAHKGLEPETVPWRFVDKDAIAFSGQGRVPVIVDDGRVVADSWDIAAYLDEAYPDRPPLFAGADARGTALFIKHWTEQVLHGLLLRIILGDVFEHLHPGDREYFRTTREQRLGCTLEEYCAGCEKVVGDLRESLGPLRATVRAQPFVGGHRPGFADYILFGAFQWARCTSPVKLLAADDPVHGWRERLLDMYGGMADAAPGYAP